MTKLQALVALLVLALAGVYALMAKPQGGGLRAFEADRLATLELDMWQAYYKKERIRLTRDLMTTLREQYHCSYLSALRVGVHWGRGASVFGSATGDYDRVLPDLEQGYAIVRGCVGATFDPAAVAKAELAWWVARRIPERQAPEIVGGLIADENALVFSVPRARVLEASVLRARAGRLRDEGGERADWVVVSDLLHQSYRALHEAVNSPDQGRVGQGPEGGAEKR